MTADVHAQAVAHVEHAVNKYPELRAIDRAVFIGIVGSSDLSVVA